MKRFLTGDEARNVIKYFLKDQKETSMLTLGECLALFKYKDSKEKAKRSYKIKKKQKKPGSTVYAGPKKYNHG